MTSRQSCRAQSEAFDADPTACRRYDASPNGDLRLLEQYYDLRVVCGRAPLARACRNLAQSSARTACGRRGVRLLAGALAAVALALTAACGSVDRTQRTSERAARSEVAALDRDRNVSTLAKSPARTVARAAESPARVQMASLEQNPEALQPAPVPRRSAPTERPLTRFVSFEAAPFPYGGEVPGRGAFLNASQGGRKGHRTWRGGVLWEDRTFGDDRVLLHIPAGFDPNRPAVMVVFFHGHGATLERDVADRQQIPAQISASGANAVLVAPQFAVDARDSSAGKFWEPGGFSRFLDEAGAKLAGLYGDAGARKRFAKMPVVLVSYSGGYISAAWSLKDMGASARMRGVLMLDSLYGEEEKFANWAAGARSAFFVSAYTRYTTRHNAALARMLADRGVASGTELPDSLSRGGVVFLATGPEAVHQDYCTQAWVESPIRDILARLPELYVRDPDTVASIGTRGRRRSAEAGGR